VTAVDRRVITEWEKATGQIRLDRRKKRLVILVQKVMEETRTSSGNGKLQSFFWIVRDLIDGQEYKQEIHVLGDKVFNEMEALAWASR